MQIHITTVVSEEMVAWRKVSGARWSEMMRVGYGMMRKRPEMFEHDRDELLKKVGLISDRLSRVSQENYRVSQENLGLRDRISKLEGGKSDA